MWGMQTNWKKKLRKALRRVDKVVIMDIRRQLEQQRKWKAEVVKRTAAGSKSKTVSINDKKETTKKETSKKAA